MIEVSFTVSPRGFLRGFEISGHSGYASEGDDIVCASVSSAAYLVANTVTEIFRLQADADVQDGYMAFSLTGSDSKSADDLFRGLKLHFEQLAQQYPAFVKLHNDNQ